MSGMELFAQSATSMSLSVDWKQLVGVIVTLVPAIGYAAWYLAGQSYKNQVDKLTAQAALAEDRVKVEREARVNAEAMLVHMTKTADEYKDKVARRDKAIGELVDKHDRVYQAYKKVYDEFQKLKLRDNEASKLIESTGAELEALKADHDALSTGHAQLTTESQGYRQRLVRFERHIKSVQKVDGLLWQKRALQSVPDFRPLEQRKRAIVSVVNLKGGVGKTTLTAHLGGALARKGYRVLMVDLDLQGSLTSMMLPRGTLVKLDKDKQLLRHFFTAAATDVTTKLSDYTFALPPDPAAPGTLSIVPTSDRLGYAEMSLTIGWLMGKGERDTRFLLRKALHLLTDNRPYDIVLLDCPPLLNISCVNALAASDYALVPTLLTRKSAERVPIFCRYVRRETFVTNLNPHLQLAGVVANRTTRPIPGGKEAVVWQDLPMRVKAAAGGDVHRFDTVIAQNADIPGSEDQFTHPGPGTRAGDAFDTLAAELESRLPHDCRIASQALPQPG